MPELPEVQTIVDALTLAGVPGNRIQSASVYWPKTIATCTPQSFCRHIKNKTIRTITRRAKFILFGLDAGTCLAVHLRMTGRFDLAEHSAPRTRHIHVVLYLDDGRCLMFHDTRKFGRFYLTQDLSLLTGALGPEPLSSRFTAKVLAQMLAGRRRQIKPLLLDQTFLAGLGNIYVDEALWAACIHPQRAAHTLDWGQVKALHRAIRSVLRQGIRNAGTSMGRGLGNYAGLQNARGRNSRYLKVFRRAEQPCFRCGNKIERLLVGQRGTYICKRCQR